MIRRTILALSILALAAHPALLAQDAAKESEALEDQALRAESRGRYEEALDGFRKAFTAAVREAGAAPTAEAKARDLAHAEFHLEKIGELTGRTTRYRETGEFLSGVDGAAVGPNLKAWVDWYRARALVAEGKIEEARALLGDLGFLTDFWIAGSFDNERGGGFGTAYPPEKGIDLDARTKGKDREVGWRRAAFETIFGYYDLDALLRPNDQSVAYAVAWIESPSDRPAVLRIGSDESVKAWVNGRQILAHDVSRACSFDQDAAAVSLRAGPNRLLLKVGDETGPWGFRVRFTHPDGAAMTDLVVKNARADADAAEAAIAARGGEGAPPPAEFSRGGVDVFGAAEKEGRAGARELFHLGWLHHRRHYEDRHDRVGMKLLEKAVEKNPDDPFLHYGLAVAAEREVEDDVDKEENARRRAAERAIELDPGYAQACYLLAHYYTYSLTLYEKAEANVRRALEVNPRFLDARILEIDLLRRRGYPVEADVRLAELLKLEEFADYTPFLAEKAEYAASRNRAPDRIATLGRALDRDFADDGARLRLIDALKDAASPEETLPLFEEILVLRPTDVGALSRKALLLEGLGRLPEAAETALRALEICPEDDQLLNQVGRIQLKLDDREKALEYWKRALELNPKFAQLRRYVEFIDPESRPYEDLFPVDLGPLLAQASEFESTENDPYLNVFRQQIDRVNPDGTSSSFHRVVVKVLNQQGVNQFDRFGAPFSPADQAIHWKLARVIHPDGSSEEARVMGRGVDLPTLHPGDVVHVEWRVDDLAQSFFGDYFGSTYYFGDWVPTLASEYVVIAPEDKELFFHSRNLSITPETSTTEDGDLKIFRFRPEEAPKLRYEPNMPPPAEVFPQVQVSNYRSWDDFARWYWQLIRNQFQVNDEIRAKVAELTKDKESRYDKIRAIYDFVVTDVRYDASWEFGVHGYKPYDAVAIWSRKFGDCKDKAILTTAMLKEIGIESYPVLIFGAGARWDEDLTLPMVGHFNHCISYVPDVDGEGRGMFLDGTAQYHSIEAMPGMDRGAKVLVVRPDGGAVVSVPWNRPEDNGIAQTFTAEIREDGSASVEADLVFKGDVAVQIRSAFSNEGQRPLLVNRFLGQMFGRATLTDFEFTDLADLETIDETLKLDVEVPKFAEKTPRGLELKLGFDEWPLSRLAAAAERKWDVLLGSLYHHEIAGTYRLPAGWKVVDRPEDVSIETSWGAVRLSTVVEDGEVRFVRRLEFRAHRVPAADYAKFREFAAAAELASKQKIVIAAE